MKSQAIIIYPETSSSNREQETVKLGSR